MTKRSRPPKLKVGDLVCMYRRRAKGLGIVLRYCDDVGEHMGEDAQTILELYKDFAVKDWRARDTFKKSICQKSSDPDLVFDFFLYNVAFKGKLKKRFAYVRWSKKPSTYSADAVYSTCGWFPAEWLRSY